jgi:hypothetical protein
MPETTEAEWAAHVRTLNTEIDALRQAVADRDAILSAVQTEWEAAVNTGASLPLNIGRILRMTPAAATTEHETQVARVTLSLFADRLAWSHFDEGTVPELFEQIVALARRAADDNQHTDTDLDAVHPWASRDRQVAREALHEFADSLLTYTLNLRSAETLRDQVADLARSSGSRADMVSRRAAH